MTLEKDILEQLKTVRKIKGYSYQLIADKTEEMGKAVSLSTVKRVFAPESTLDAFRYDSTIQPIASVVLGFSEETELPNDNDPDQDKEYYATIEAYKTVVRIKNGMIDSLQKSLDEKTAELDRARSDMEYARSAYQQGIDDRNRTIRNLTIALFVLLVIVGLAIALDLMLGSVGWIRRAASDFMSLL